MCVPWLYFIHSDYDVFYGTRNPDNGALGSNYVLHEMKELNHHFQVFQGGALSSIVTSRLKGRSPLTCRASVDGGITSICNEC